MSFYIYNVRFNLILLNNIFLYYFILPMIKFEFNNNKSLISIFVNKRNK